MNYRRLTEKEIAALKERNCWAEDWGSVYVSAGFETSHMYNVMLYGNIRIGAFEKNLEVSKGFFKHSGIRNATLRNVKVGDNCLIENVGNFINNYVIGDDCYISNVSTIETTECANYGEGNLISVLNEMGDGNLVLFGNLNSQFAAFMVKHFHDKELKDIVRRLIQEEIKKNKNRLWHYRLRGKNNQYQGNNQHKHMRRLRSKWCRTAKRLHGIEFVGGQCIYRYRCDMRKFHNK